MKEKPILFSSPMVRAILEGRKSMTRRALKPLRQDDRTPYVMWPVYERGKRYESSANPDRAAPYTPGMKLWVRETWAYPLINDSVTQAFVYRADGERTDLCDGRWSSPIHMPRWASRIALLVKEVRVERLQDISEADTIAEGCRRRFQPEGNEVIEWSATLSFARLWDSINGKRAGCAWADNPWVAAIGFERLP